jgi:hypothetical protein
VHPTVTDANLVLGRYDPAHFAGGSVALDTAAAWHTQSEQLESDVKMRCRQFLKDDAASIAMPAAARSVLKSCCLLGLGFLAVTIATTWTPLLSHDRNARSWRCVRFFQCFSHASTLVTVGRPTTCLAWCRKSGTTSGPMTEGRPGVFAHMRC